MGYHTNVIAVRGRKLADLAKALPDESLFADTDAVVVGLEGTTDTYWFRYYAKGELQRSIKYTQRSEVEESTGGPHPAEANVKLPKWGRDEDWGFTVLERITKITRKQLDEATYLRVLFG